ncbi:uncharacterized protein LOC123619236 [Camelus bactrianus]|uniref:Uncharacterized protein LOC123619236 n=1 Tax=Camelus bactrianus TaxID=9837 RepID=A0AC58RH94_CAMBA
MAARTGWQRRWEGLGCPRDPCGYSRQGPRDREARGGPGPEHRDAAGRPPRAAPCRRPVPRAPSPGGGGGVGGGGGLRKGTESRAAAERRESARPGPRAAGPQARRARACGGERGGERGRPAPARSPERARRGPRCVGGGRAGRRPGCVTFPVHPTVDSSSQRGRELARCARLAGKFTGRTLARKPSLCSPLACGLREAARPLWTLYPSAVIWERRQQVFQAKGDISSSPNIVPDDLVFAKLSTEFHVCALQIGSAGPATSDPISHSNTVFILFSWKSCESFKTQQARPLIFPHSPGGSRAPSLEDLVICTNLHSRTCNGMTCGCLSSPTGL